MTISPPTTSCEIKLISPITRGKNFFSDFLEDQLKDFFCLAFICVLFLLTSNIDKASEADDAASHICEDSIKLNQKFTRKSTRLIVSVVQGQTRESLMKIGVLFYYQLMKTCL